MSRGSPTRPQDQTGETELACRRTSLKRMIVMLNGEGLLLDRYRAGLPSARAITVWPVPPVQSCTPAAAIDDFIRNRMDGVGMTSLDGDSARESA